MKIAVADDEPDIRDYLRWALTRRGHEVFVASDGKQLLELCRTCAPDLVLTDWRMPDLDGLSAAAEINRERHVPVILLSATPEAGLAACPEGDFLVASLRKPVKWEDLGSAIDGVGAGTRLTA